MKKIKQYILLLLGVSLVSSISSCLKDTASTVNFAVSQPVIEQLTGSNYFNGTANGNQELANQNSYFLPVRIDSTGSFTDSIIINVAGTLINKDVEVTIGIDNTAFTNFNSNNSGVYTSLPSSGFTISNPTVTIKAGQRSVNAYITFNSTQINFGNNNILPISITSVTGGIGISGNYGTIMYAIVPANQYAGLYSTTGQRTEGSNVYSISGVKYLYDYSGITEVQGGFPTARTGPTGFVTNAVVADCADQTIYLAFGEQMDLTVNPDNSVIVSNDFLYEFGVFTFSLVSGSSNYVPSSHTFNLSYGFIDPSNGDSSVVSETLTRLK
jgi:hypothetical protein